MRFSTGISKLSMNNSLVSWLTMLRMGLAMMVLPISGRTSTKNTDRPSVFFFTSARGVVRASSSM